MKKNLRTLVFSCLLSGILLASQAADTLRINLTYKHILNNSGQTTGFITIKQQFYTPDGEYFRQINYDENTGAPIDYTYLFYRDNKLFTEECYDFSDSLLYILKHEYDAAGNETMLTKLVPTGKSLTGAEKIIKAYNANHKILSLKKYFGKQIGSITKYKYDASGNLIYEKTTNKPVAKAGSKQEVKEYSHSSDGKIQRVANTNKDLSGNVIKYLEEYGYSTAGLLNSIKKTNSGGTVTGEKVYKHLPSMSPSMFEEHDASGKIILLIEYDYRKHYMDKGTQVSYYESL